MNRSREQAVALVSGGLDSTVALALARKSHTIPLGIFFDYGQRAARRELESAEAVTKHYGMSLERVDLPWLGRISSSALIDGGGDIPDAGARELADGSLSGAVWIENRNGIFVSIAASFAASMSCSSVVVGFNAEEASSFPDNSGRFIDALNRALADGTSNGVRVISPTIEMSKRDIVLEGLRLGVPWHSIWSCYRGESEMCGRCESCSRLRSAAEGTEALGLLRFGKE